MSLANAEQSVALRRRVQNRLQAHLVAIGNENLSELLARNHLDQLLHTSRIELVEQVVQQQYRSLALVLGNNLILSQFQRNKKRFLLSLRAIFSQWIAANFQSQIITMNATTRELIDQVLLSVRAQQLLEGGVVQLRAVADLDLLAVARQLAVVVCHYWTYALDELGTLLVHCVAVCNQLLVKDIEYLILRCTAHLFEQSVALREDRVVAHNGTKIAAIELRKKGVEESTSLLGSVTDEHRVGRRDDHDGDQSHVVRQTVVLLSCALDALASATRERTDNLFVTLAVGRVPALNHKELFAVANALSVGHSEGRLAHREVVDCVDDVGFACAVVTHQTVDVGRECEALLLDVLEID